MIDYLIVGSGLAGIAFAETASQHQKSFLVIDGHLQSSSNVAGGLYNPVILKRFTALAHAKEQLQTMHGFYKGIESKLGQQFDFRLPVLRKFASVEEQNNWFIAADKPGMADFLSTDLLSKKYTGIDSPYDYGKVNGTGYVDVSAFLEKYKEYLSSNHLLLTEIFDYNKLEINSTGIKYKNTTAVNIIFAEGFGVHANPFFKELPLDGAKGELLIIKAPGLSLDVILNTSIFILPLGNDLFKIGATYNWTDKTDIPTQEAKAELIERLREILTCDFEVIAHHAGVRPTVKDRKALIGTHADFSTVHILNGLGTRGVMLGPSMAKTLFEYIEFGIPIPRELDIKRFDKRK
jgi:glycine oxidase